MVGLLGFVEGWLVRCYLLPEDYYNSTSRTRITA